jgi:uncharacterized phage-associated protein
MFNARKAAQVIAYLAMKSQNRTLDVLKAVKLVYLADRESIKVWGAPILEDEHVSMKHGPVNSRTYSHINGEHDLAKSGWSNFLEDRADHVIAAVSAISEDDLDELSEADTQILDKIWEQFGRMSKWEIRDWTHVRENIPEWEDPGETSNRIPLERIMRAVGLSDIDEHVQLLADYKNIDRIFASLRK